MNTTIVWYNLEQKKGAGNGVGIHPYSCRKPTRVGVASSVCAHVGLDRGSYRAHVGARKNKGMFLARRFKKDLILKPARNCHGSVH